MEKSLLINHDWQGNVPVYLSRTKNNFYSISFRVSPTSGDLIVEVDAPFYDDPPPLARPQQSDGLAQNLFKVPPTPHSPPPSVPSTLIRSEVSDLDVYFTSSADNGDDEYGVSDKSEYYGSPPTLDVQLDKYHYPGLHNFEVVEIFVASCHNTENLSENPYIEIQVGPHGHYMLVSFEREEDWETQNASIKLDRIPTTRIDRATMRWTSEIYIPSFLLPEPFCSVDNSNLTVKWHVNVCAIHGIEEERQHLSHAVYQSSIPIPNFHQLDYFVPLVLRESSPKSPPPSHPPPPLPPLPPQYAMMGMMPLPTTPPPPPPPIQSTSTMPQKPPPLPPMKSTTTTSSSSSSGAILTSSSTATDHSYSYNTSSMQDLSSLEPVHNLVSLNETAWLIKSEQTESSLDESGLEPLFEKSLLQGEFDVVHGVVWKRKDFSYKKRMLILTNTARLLYFTMGGVFKGCVPWTLTKPVKITKINSTKFDIEVFDKSRIYHFSDSVWGSGRWVDAINKFMEAQQAYLHASLRRK